MVCTKASTVTRTQPQAKPGPSTWPSSRSEADRHRGPRQTSANGHRVPGESEVLIPGDEGDARGHDLPVPLDGHREGFVAVGGEVRCLPCPLKVVSREPSVLYRAKAISSKLPRRISGAAILFSYVSMSSLDGDRCGNVNMISGTSTPNPLKKLISSAYAQCSTIFPSAILNMLMNPVSTT
jgi:hypothetical protein